jgi:alginate O-acetyltransferase complex protein AlgI
MGFSTITFLFYFFPAALIIYYLVPGRAKFPLLLAASYAFFLWGSPTGAVILALGTIFDYLLGKAIWRTEGQRVKKSLLAFSVIVNVLVLFYFKYMNFFVGELNRALKFADLSTIPWSAVIFPVGISFITFHKISYLVDIYYGRVEPTHRFADYALYLAMFPKLTQGPIVRYHTIAEQLSEPKYSLDDIYEGSLRFSTGLAKKVLLADPMSAVANPIFSMDISTLTVGYAWLGAVCYSFQLYFDFSGYTDMAIGIGRMLGFTLPENFNRPFYSLNFTDHWKRWHMSLVNWFREYLYIPLGGNRAGNFKTYRNLWIVFIVSGLWHGANWTYLVWGIYNGFFMFIDRLFLVEKMKRLPAAVNIAIFYVLLLIGYVVFRSDTLTGALGYLHRMFDVTAIGAVRSPVLWANLIGNREIFVMIVCALISFFPQPIIDNVSSSITSRAGKGMITAMKTAAACLIFVLSLISLINNSFSPFIYFRF